MSRPISYGPGVADDRELRLCGDVTGKRTLELGLAGNAVALAALGAKAIAVDPDAEHIAAGRLDAEDSGVRVEFHHGDLADLGFATSGSIDLALAVGSLAAIDDLARVLRQVHRVLRPEAPLVVGAPHPVAAMFDPGDPTARRPYGTPPARPLADLFMALYRANFRVDAVHELPPPGSTRPLAPAVLVVRARKLGV